MLTQVFKSKPIILEGIVLTKNNIDEAAAWCGGEVRTESSPRDRDDVYQYLIIPTLGGGTNVPIGEFLLRNRDSGRFTTAKKEFIESEFDIVIMRSEMEAVLGKPRLGENK